MANEITLGVTMTVTNGYYRLARNISQSFNQATPGGGNPGIVSVSTTAGNLSFTGMTQRGYTFVHNLDTTNYIELGIDDSGTFVPVIKLKAGEFALFRWTASQTIQARANTATCRVQIDTLED